MTKARAWTFELRIIRKLWKLIDFSVIYFMFMWRWLLEGTNSFKKFLRSSWALMRYKTVLSLRKARPTFIWTTSLKLNCKFSLWSEYPGNMNIGRLIIDHFRGDYIKSCSSNKNIFLWASFNLVFAFLSRNNLNLYFERSKSVLKPS